jgi:hypothetical protein
MRVVACVIVLLALGCRRESSPAPDTSPDAPRPPQLAAPSDVLEAATVRVPPDAAATDSRPMAPTADAVAEAVEVDVAPAAEVETAFVPPGLADLDPTNDGETGPPAAIDDCEARLRAAGVDYTLERPLSRRLGRDGPECGTTQPITYREGPGRIRWSPLPLINCAMGLALARLEAIAQEEAQRWLGSRIVHIEQRGTYGCRRIARFPGLLSEHSYANAIDVRSFELEDGRTVTVDGDFGALREDPSTPESRFLRQLAHRLYDEDVFSCVLTPYWDSLHHDHFHLDLARYRVDGSR